MVSVPIDLVYEKMRKEGRNLYDVKDGANLIACNDDPTIDVEMAIQDLADVIDNISGNAVYIELSHPSNRGSNGGTKRPILKFRVQINNPGSSRSTGPGNGDTNAMLFKMLMDSNERQMQLIQSLGEKTHEIRAKELEFTIKDLTRQKDEIGNTSYLDLFANKVGKILLEADRLETATMGVKSTPISGTETEAEAAKAEPATEKAKRLKAALRKLQQIDPENFLDNLELLANYAEANPAMYEMVIKTMKGGKDE